MVTLSSKRIKAIENRIQDIDEVDRFIKILVYGQNGSEKTRFGASGPNCVIIDINEKGTKSARQFKGTKVFPVKKWEDATYFMWYLRTVDHPYETVVIDNLTTLQQMCMSHVLKEAGDRDPNKDPAMATMREWGKCTELIKPLLLHYRNLPMHVVFIAQEREIEEDDESTMHTPDMPRGTRGIATGAVDVIGRAYKKEVRTGKGKKEKSTWEPRMLVGPHDEFITKDRTGKLGRIIRRPSVPKILEAAFGEEDDE